MGFCDVSFLRCRKILNAEKVAAYYRLLARMYMQYVLAMCSKNFFVLDGRSGNLAIGVKNVVCCWKNIIGMRRNRDVCWKR